MLGHCARTITAKSRTPVLLAVCRRPGLGAAATLSRHSRGHLAVSFIGRGDCDAVVGRIRPLGGHRRRMQDEVWANSSPREATAEAPPSVSFLPAEFRGEGPYHAESNLHLRKADSNFPSSNNILSQALSIF